MKTKFALLLVFCAISLNIFAQEKKIKDSLKSASNLNGNLNCSKELEHYAS